MCVYPELSDEHRETLQAIFESPCRSNILWSNAIELLSALEHSHRAVIHRDQTHERVCLSIDYGNVSKVAVLPCLHGQTCMTTYTTETLQFFLLSVGITPFTT
jgi:hypothetical protein